MKVKPKIHQSAKIFPGAQVIGDVTIEANVNIWFNAVIRGDMASIHIGENTNIQDSAIVHTDTLSPTYIGKNITVGHGAIIHACTVEDDALIGMGSIVLDNAIVKRGAMVAAGCLVPPGKVVPDYALVVGNPMRIVRQLTEAEIEANRENVRKYLHLMAEYD
ncbi:MAG: gamma carbonic anhydrase family protein [Bacilli bacterium]|nr:gamma carbonic anhydrase family protein [Bacilli bacterium]MBN2696559.1 gamma carbonic anhydrase family protein [Bacilli bacterium]